MIGAFLGFVISLIVVLTTDVGNWWLLWGSLIGFAFELACRVGAGGDFADAFVASVDVAESIGDISDSSSD